MSSDNTQLFIDDGINVDLRIIHLFDDIDSDSVGKVIKGLQLIMAKNSELPIDIYINTFGGDPYSGLALYSYIRSLGTIVIRLHALGAVMSAGSIIFMAGDERYIYSNSVLMLHSVSSFAEGKVHLALEDEAEECKRLHKQMCEIYAAHSKQDFNYWNKRIKYKDIYIRPEEAVTLGLVDKIVKEE